MNSSPYPGHSVTDSPSDSYADVFQNSNAIYNNLECTMFWVAKYQQIMFYDHSLYFYDPYPE